MTHVHRSRRTAALVAAAALSATVLTPVAARAASGTWSGAAADGLWVTPGNWDTIPGVADGTAVSPDVATFTGTPASVAVTVDANRNIAGLTFTSATINGDDPASLPFTIGSTTGNALTLSAGGTTQVTSSVSYNQGSNSSTTTNESVSAPVLLAGPTYTFLNNASTGVGLVFRGTVSPAAGATSTTLTLDGSNVGPSSNTGASQIVGTITNGAGGATLGIVKNGSGTWELHGGNTYSGDTVVNAGLLRFVNDAAGVEAASPNTHLIVNNGGKIRFSTNGAISPAIEIRSGGVVDTSNSSTGIKISTASGPAMYLNYSSAATTVFYSASGSISLSGAVAGQGGIKLSATATQASVNFGSTSSPLDLGAVLRPFDIGLTNPSNTDPNNASATGYDFRVRGPISGAGGGILKTGPGTLRLDNATLSFTGPIEVQQGELRINTSDALPGTNALTVDGGNFRLLGGQVFRFPSVTVTKGGITASNSASTVKSPTYAFNVASGDTATADAVLADPATGGSATLTKSGAGTATLTAGNTYTGAATVNAGTLVVAGSARSALLASTGGVDIKGGKVVFDYTGGTSSVGTVAGLLASSYAATPHFSAGQFRSSTADATHGLGYADDGASKLTVMYTYYGDLNLDGKVNADDYALIDRATAVNQSGGSLTGWANGDINYSGTIDSADYLLMDTVYGTSGVAHDTWAALLADRASEFGDAYVSQLVAAVPEPTCLAACGLVVLPLLRRRRK